MTEREKLYIEELQSKVAKYEDFLNEALEGPFKVGTVVAGPNSSLYLVKSSDSNVIIPANPSIKDDLKVGTVVMINDKIIISVLSEELIEKEPEIDFQYINWGDIGGIKSQMEKIRDAVESPYKYKKYYNHFGLKAPKGVLLYGEPGCGKTMIAKAIASFLLRDQKLSKDSFVYLKGGELLNPYVGVTESRIKSIFDNARANFRKTGQKSVIFIDEAEAILPARGSRMSSDVDTTIVPTFLSEMDGFDENETFIILATNYANRLDPAVIRPGRIDLHVEISRPTKLDTEEIFAIHLQKTKYSGNLDIICKEATNALFETDHVHKISGAMIANIVQSSVSTAIKRLILSETNNSIDKTRSVTVNDILKTIKSL